MERSESTTSFCAKVVRIVTSSVARSRVDLQHTALMLSHKNGRSRCTSEALVIRLVNADIVTNTTCKECLIEFGLSLTWCQAGCVRREVHASDSS